VHPELLDLYNRELALLYEHAQDFAKAYPGVAKQLGDLTRERTDPMLVGLLEGTALLAARVQLKLKDEFAEFTNNLIEQLYPNFLAPLPSVFLARVSPKFGDPGLREGRRVARGSTLDSIYKSGKDARVSCQFTLCSDITYWPFEITGATYHPSPASLRGTQAEFGADVASGLQLSLQVRTTPELKDEPSDEEARGDDVTHFAGCETKDLTIHFVGPEAEAIGLYEQLFANLRSVLVRYVDEFNDPIFIEVPLSDVEQIGFDEDDFIIPRNHRIFAGFSLLQEYFLFPRKFMGVRIKGLERVLSKIPSNKIDFIFMFDRLNPRLPAAINKSMFALYAAPAVNLFKKTSDRIEIDTNRHEYHLVPDRSEPVNFEAHRVLEAFLHYPGRAEKRELLPLYLSTINQASRTGASEVYYSIRRVPRKRSEAEKSRASVDDYVGSEVYISTTSPNEEAGEGRLQVSAVALCSNRHLADIIPVGQQEWEFKFRENTELVTSAAVPPTRPRESLLMMKNDVLRDAGMGPTAWKLINVLSLNHFGLSDPDGAALREILSLFADTKDPVVVRRILGVRHISSRPVIRRLQQRLGVGVARGIEVTVTLEDKAFEGHGAFIMGAVLERFFAEYAAVNHFTVTVVKTVERGVIMTWPARSGSRSAI
jgi:type VI secretion system protein ImpG